MTDTKPQGRSKWPQEIHDLLKAVMLRDNFYSHHKLVRASNAKFDCVMKEFRHVVDRSGWVPSVHDDLFRHRVRNKITHLRIQMVETGEIIKCGKVYAKNPRYNADTKDEKEPEEATMNTCHVLWKAFEYAGDVGEVIQYLAAWDKERQQGLR